MYKEVGVCVLKTQANTHKQTITNKSKSTACCTSVTCALTKRSAVLTRALLHQPVGDSTPWILGVIVTKMCLLKTLPCQPTSREKVLGRVGHDRDQGLTSDDSLYFIKRQVHINIVKDRLDGISFTVTFSIKNTHLLWNLLFFVTKKEFMNNVKYSHLVNDWPWENFFLILFTDGSLGNVYCKYLKFANRSWSWKCPCALEQTDASFPSGAQRMPHWFRVSFTHSLHIACPSIPPDRCTQMYACAGPVCTGRRSSRAALHMGLALVWRQG